MIKNKYKHSIETIEKIKNARVKQIMKPHTEETKTKMSLAKFGKKRNSFSKEWRENMSLAHIGKKLSEEHKKKISIIKLENNPFKRLDVRKKLSEKAKLRVGNLNPFYGKKHSEETKKKISEFNKTKIGIKNSFYGKHHSKEAREKIKAKLDFLKEKGLFIMPKQDSSIEVKIQNFLKQLQIEFYTHYWMNEIEHKYQCDIFIPSKKIIIECFGDYWHKYPIGKEIDSLRCQELREKGYRILVFWEKEIKVMELNDLRKELELYN